ncbi:helix-turn-helix domain-containing protein [Nocardiopsis nanhaiensis]
MATIGQTLSAARIAAGCSLENLSTRTRIRMQVLRGIENEDFVPCGGDFYARGHIRRICKYLGIDPAPLLEEYDREHASTEKPTFIPPQRLPSAKSESVRVAAAQGGPPSIGDEDTDPEQRAENWGHFERTQKLARRPRGKRAKPAAAGVPEPRRSGRRGRAKAQKNRAAPVAAAARPAVTRTRTRGGEKFRQHWPWAVVAVIIVAGVFVGVRTWQGWEDGNPARTAFESVREDGGDTVDSSVLSEEEAAKTSEEAAVEDTGPAEGEAGEFTVALSAYDRTWVKVSDLDGGDLFTGFLTNGEAEDFVTEEPVTVWVGNAGAVEVAIDGEDLGPSGGFGEVKEITVGADGIDD